MAEQTGAITGDRDLSAYAPSDRERLGGTFMELLDQTKTSVAYRQTQAVTLAKLRSPRTGRDILQETAFAMNELAAGADPEEAIEQEKQIFADAEQRRYMQFIRENITSTDPNIRESVAEYISQGSLIARDRADDIATPDGAHKIISELYATESVTDYKKRDEAAASYAVQRARDFSEERGTFESAYDWIMTFLGTDTAKDAADLTGRDEFFDVDGLMDAIRVYQVLDPEEKIEFFDSIFPRIVEAYDFNHVKIENVVAAMHDPQGPESLAMDVALESIVGIGLDAPDIIKWTNTLLNKSATRLGLRKSAPALSDEDLKSSSILATPAPVATAKSVAKQHSEPHKLSALGNDEAAAEAATLAGLDPSQVNVTMMSSLDAASTASPFRLGEMPIFNYALDGISDLMQNLNRQSVESVIARKMREINDVRRGITVTQRRAAEKVASEVPREIDRLRREILAMEEALKRGKTDIPGKRKSMPMSQSTRSVLESQIVANAGRIQGLMQSLDGATSVVAAVGRADNLNAELMALRSGFVPDQLAEAINDAIQARMTQRTSANLRSTELNDARKAKVEDLAKGSSDDVAELSVRGAVGAVAARVLDDPLSYGLNENYAESLRVLLQQPINDLTTELNKLAPEIMTAQRKGSVMQEVIDKVIKEAENAEQNIRVADISDMTKDGFTITFLRDGKQERLQYKFSYNDIGVMEGISFIENAKPSILSRLLSPEAMFREFGNFVNDFTFAGDQAAKAANRLMKLNKDIRSGLSSAERQDLDVLLAAGDEQSRVFTYEELRAGLVETEFSIKSHSNEVIDAYYKTRVILDELHDMRNGVARGEMVSNNYKELTYKDAKGVEQKTIIQDIENFRGQDIADEESIWIPVGLPAGNKPYSNFAAVKKNIKQWKDQGYKVVKLAEPHGSAKGNKVHYALVEESGQTTRISELPKQVLNYQPGYIPRIYKNSYHFVKDVSDPSKPNTWFAAETREEANKLRDSLVAFSGNKKLVVTSNRELASFERLALQLDQYGGLYTGARKRDNLMVRRTDGSLSRPDRVSTGQAIQRYIANISSMIPLGEYRAGIMHQWMNTVKALADKSGFDGLVDPTDFRSEVRLPEHQKFMMEQAREYIDRQLGMPSAEEKLFAMKLKQMSDALYPASQKSKAAEWARAATIGMMDRDPVQQLKGFAFNAQMGWFNMRQFVVQVQNAVIAVAVDPKNGLKAIPDAMAMRMAVLSKDEETWRRAAKLTGNDPDEFVDSIRKFHESGLMDSIKREADFDANVVSKGSATTAGLRKIAESGRVFFTEGELMSRLVSFNIARRRLGPNATTRELFDEHLRLSMNMQSANAAMWQKNWLGVPTQYMQVFAKFYERVLPALIYGRQKGGWTRAEARRVLGVQLAMYGSVGVPGSVGVYNYLAELNGTTPQEIAKHHTWIQELYEEGVGGLAAYALGFENNYSPSLSLLSGTFDNTVSDMVGAIYDGVMGNQSDLTVYDILTGPSGSAAARGVDAIGSMVRTAQVLTADFSFELMGKEVLSTMDDFLAITSSWSNARKALFLQDIGLQSKRSNTLIDADKFQEINWQTLFGKALGFETDIEKNYWSVKGVNRDSQAIRKEDTAALKKAWTMYQRTGDLKRYKAHEALILEGKSPGERIQLRQVIQKGLTGDSDYDRQAEFFLRDLIMSGGRVPIHPAMNNPEVQ